MSALSVCLVPNVHCTRSQQLRTICTCVTDHTHKFVWYTSQMQRTSRTKWVKCVTIISSFLEKCFWHNYQTNNDPRAISKEVLYASAARTTLHTTDGMVFYSWNQSSIYWNNSSIHWNEIFNLLSCKVEQVIEAVSGFTNSFSSSFEGIDLYFMSFGIPVKPGIAKDLIEADDISRKAVANFIDLLLVENLSFTTP